MERIKRELYCQNEKNEGLDGDNDMKTTLFSPLVALILSIRKRNVNNCIKEIKGFDKINIYYTDKDSL